MTGESVAFHQLKDVINEWRYIHVCMYVNVYFLYPEHAYNNISFYDFQNTKEEFRTDNSLWHGSLMLLAWCFLVPNGIFLSRYFKESFVDVSIFKYRLWFAVCFITCSTYVFKFEISNHFSIKYFTSNFADIGFRDTASLW